MEFSYIMFIGYLSKKNSKYITMNEQMLVTEYLFLVIGYINIVIKIYSSKFSNVTVLAFCNQFAQNCKFCCDFCNKNNNAHFKEKCNWYHVKFSRCRHSTLLRFFAHIKAKKIVDNFYILISKISSKICETKNKTGDTIF